MIDFRYHLVSLISVFLALAVGIVLGAGPLRENLGSQLTGQVEQLRTERDELRTAHDELALRTDELTGYIQQTGPQLVAGTLEGESVAVISDGDSLSPALDQVASLLRAAGAEEQLSIRLDPRLWDPAAEEARTEALASLREISPGLVADAESTATSSSGRLAVLVARLATDPAASPADREAMWEVLSGQGLVAVDGDRSASVDALIVAATAPGEHVVRADDAAASAARALLLQDVQTGLLARLAEAQVPSVIAASTPGNDDSAGMLRTARGDARFAALSTTDRLQEADGPVLAVLALVEQTRGGEGSYGTASDARSRVPEVSGLPADGGQTDGGQMDGGQTGEQESSPADEDPAAGETSDGGEG